MCRPKLVLMFVAVYCFLLGCSDKSKQTEKIKSAEVAIKPEAIIQKCNYNGLSKEFDIQVFVKRFESKDNIVDSCLVNLIISDKITHKDIDTLFLLTSYYFPDVFQNCNYILLTKALME